RSTARPERSSGASADHNNQTLLEAIGNLRREAHDTRQQAEYAARQQEHVEQQRRIAAQQKAEREASRPVCAGCGTQFTDARWKAVEPTGWDAPRDTHPHLCDDCKQNALTADAHRASPARASSRASAKGAWNLDVPLPQMRDWAPNAWHSRKLPGARRCHA
ncbi:hypothetical protein ACH4HW_34875, partial [Streptomyces rochei]